MKLIILVITLLTIICSSNLFASNVDLSKSLFSWKATKITGDTHIGTIAMKSAKVSLKEGKLFGGEFIANIHSIDVTDLSGKWKKKFLKHMKNEDFFEVSKYPTAKFVISKYKKNKLDGVLTIKGKSHHVSFNVKEKNKTLNAKLIFNRTKFGMIYASGNFFKNLGDKVIKDDIELTIKIVLK